VTTKLPSGFLLLSLFSRLTNNVIAGLWHFSPVEVKVI